jgi:hypothetical protein
VREAAGVVRTAIANLHDSPRRRNDRNRFTFLPPFVRGGFKEDTMITLQKILVPTDFSDLSQQALEFALSLADRFRAKLYLMHVWELPMTGSLLPPEPYPESVLTEEQTAGEEHLTKVANELKASGFDVEPVLFLGSPIWRLSRRQQTRTSI